MPVLSRRPPAPFEDVDPPLWRRVPAPVWLLPVVIVVGFLVGRTLGGHDSPRAPARPAAVTLPDRIAPGAIPAATVVPWRVRLSIPRPKPAPKPAATTPTTTTTTPTVTTPTSTTPAITTAAPTVTATPAPAPAPAPRPAPKPRTPPPVTFDNSG